MPTRAAASKALAAAGASVATRGSVGGVQRAWGLSGWIFKPSSPAPIPAHHFPSPSSAEGGLLAGSFFSPRCLSRAGPARCLATHAPGGTTASRSLWSSLMDIVADYKQLSKFKLSLLVVSTAAGGYVLGSGDKVDWAGLGWASLGTMGCAASANAFNQIYEVKLDSLMKRTMNRPLPSGRLSRLHALAFALGTGVAGTTLLATKANTLTAGLGVANIALYGAVYTPLKTVSIANTWIGAVVGAVPPLMGWTAAAGDITPGAAALAAVLYWWQMPHFMALAWMCRTDYAAGGYKMLSLVDATGRRTAACALRNCIYLMPLGILAVALGVTTDTFAFENALISGGMAATAGVFYQSPGMANARLLFRASLLHLPLLMAAMIAHRLPNCHLSAADLRDRFRERFEAKPSHLQASPAPALVPLAPFPFLPVPMAVVEPEKETAARHQPSRPTSAS